MTSTPSPEQLSSLSAMSSGDTRVAEAWPKLRDYAANNASTLGEHIYATLRQIAYRTLTSRPDEETAGWYELTKRVAALLRASERSDLAERLRALADLMGQTVRFAARHSVDDVLARKHVLRILKTLESRGGTVRRAEVAHTLGLAEANLSRIISNLLSVGLVVRQMAGREVDLSLTALAREALGKRKDVPRPEGGILDGLPVALAAWNDDGSVRGSSKAFRKLCRLLGDSEALDLGSWRALASRSKTAILPDGTKEVMAPDGRVFAVVEHAAAGVVWVNCFDLSPHGGGMSSKPVRAAVDRRSGKGWPAGEDAKYQVIGDHFGPLPGVGGVIPHEQHFKDGLQPLITSAAGLSPLASYYLREGKVMRPEVNLHNDFSTRRLGRSRERNSPTGLSSWEPKLKVFAGEVLNECITGQVCIFDKAPSANTFHVLVRFELFEGDEPSRGTGGRAVFVHSPSSHAVDAGGWSGQSAGSGIEVPLTITLPIRTSADR